MEMHTCNFITFIFLVDTVRHNISFSLTLFVLSCSIKPAESLSEILEEKEHFSDISNLNIFMLYVMCCVCVLTKDICWFYRQLGCPFMDMNKLYHLIILVSHFYVYLTYTCVDCLNYYFALSPSNNEHSNMSHKGEII